MVLAMLVSLLHGIEGVPGAIPYAGPFLQALLQAITG